MDSADRASLQARNLRGGGRQGWLTGVRRRRTPRRSRGASDGAPPDAFDQPEATTGTRGRRRRASLGIGRTSLWRPRARPRRPTSRLQAAGTVETAGTGSGRRSGRDCRDRETVPGAGCRGFWDRGRWGHSAVKDRRDGGNGLGAETGSRQDTAELDVAEGPARARSRLGRHSLAPVTTPDGPPCSRRHTPPSSGGTPRYRPIGRERPGVHPADPAAPAAGHRLAPACHTAAARRELRGCPHARDLDPAGAGSNRRRPAAGPGRWPASAQARPGLGDRRRCGRCWPRSRWRRDSPRGRSWRSPSSSSWPAIRAHRCSSATGSRSTARPRSRCRRRHSVARTLASGSPASASSSTIPSVPPVPGRAAQPARGRVLGRRDRRRCWCRACSAGWRCSPSPGSSAGWPGRGGRPRARWCWPWPFPSSTPAASAFAEPLIQDPAVRRAVPAHRLALCRRSRPGRPVAAARWWPDRPSPGRPGCARRSGSRPHRRGLRSGGLTTRCRPSRCSGSCSPPRKPQWMPFGIGLVVGVGYGLADGYCWRGRTWTPCRPGWARSGSSPAAVTVVTVDAACCWRDAGWARCRRGGCWPRPLRWLPEAVAALAVLAVVGFAVRPYVQTVRGGLGLVGCRVRRLFCSGPRGCRSTRRRTVRGGHAVLGDLVHRLARSAARRVRPRAARPACGARAHHVE